MKIDPLVEWQRLSETYSRMYDAELLELAAATEELTDQARQVLSDEVRKRGLNPSRPERTAPAFSNSPPETAAPMRDPFFSPPKIVPDEPQADDEEEAPREYSWKTALCGCDTQEEAQQLSEALRRAGIDNWIARPGARQAIAWDERMVGNLQILVAADQLEEAREIAAKPIPREIVEESQIEVPEYEPPSCPKCGAADPILENVDPVNRWHCDACGNDWTETEETDGHVPAKV
jgi:hypothetical protein